MPVSVSSADRQRQHEADARAAIEQRLERKLTEEEWATIRSKLVEFATILIGWAQTAHSQSPKR